MEPWCGRRDPKSLCKCAAREQGYGEGIPTGCHLVIRAGPLRMRANNSLTDLYSQGDPNKQRRYVLVPVEAVVMCVCYRTASKVTISSLGWNNCPLQAQTIYLKDALPTSSLSAASWPVCPEK
jgi:hypothetical protein